MKFIQQLAILYLVAFGFLIWGIFIGKYQVFPYQYLKNVQDFIEGDDSVVKTTTVDKVISELGIEPKRHLVSYPSNAIENTSLTSVPGLKGRREQPWVFIDPKHREGYRAVFGALDFEQSFWGGLLLDREGNVLHTWDLSTEHLPTKKWSEETRVLYGVYLFPDGSVIFSQQEPGGGIVKVDACSNVVWNLVGNYHHTIAPTDDGFFWTYVGNQEDYDHRIAKVSIDTGKIDTVINMADVRKNNPFVHIFNLEKDFKNIEFEDISHGNDIEPLSAKLATKFKMFNAGDLLMSYRTHNLVFILDPNTLKIKWWRMGVSDKQHDPDWEEDGTISIFSNNLVPATNDTDTGRKYSDIISIEPASYSHKTIVNGEAHKFFSSVNGTHQRTEFGTRMIASTVQGWAFEIDQNNNIVFSFVNNYEREKNKSLYVSDAMRLRENYFSEEFWNTCDK